MLFWSNNILMLNYLPCLRKFSLNVRQSFFIFLLNIVVVCMRLYRIGFSPYIQVIFKNRFLHRIIIKAIPLAILYDTTLPQMGYKNVHRVK